MQQHWLHGRGRVWNRMQQGMALALVLVLAAAGPIPARAQGISDVPTDHWAYSAVQRLVDEGYLTLADDRTFRGDEPVDRYTFAAAIARVLDQVGEESSGLPADIEEILRRLVTEFNQELVAWQAAREDLERRTAAIDSELQALTAEGGPLDVALRRVGALEEEAAQRAAALAELARQAGELSAALARLRDDLGLQTGTLDQRLAEFQNQIEGDLGVQGINLGQSLADLAQRLQETSENLAQQAAVSSELQREVAELQRQAAELQRWVEELQTGLEEQRQAMTGADGQLLAEIRGLSNRLDVLQSTPGTVAGVQASQLRLERQLAALERDFETYRLQAEEETKRLRTTSTVGAAAALVAIVAALVVNK